MLDERLCALASAILLAMLGGCGGGSASPVVARVGDAQISRATVEHWSGVIARGEMIGGFQDATRGTLRQRATAFLISMDWLRGEAALQGAAPTSRSVSKALDDRREANGAGEFQQSLRASGQTAHDVMLELEAELARASIRRKLLAQSPAVTEQEIVSYYKSNRRRFRNPETRIAELIEDLPSPAAATALVKRIGIGSRFRKKALREEVQRTEGLHLQPDIERLRSAIFAAPLGVASRPMSLNGHWTVFVVRSTTPATAKPLQEVRASIVSHLNTSHRRAALGAFARGYRRRWTAATSCRPAYVVQGCAQYAGPIGAQPNPFAGE